MTPLSFVVPSYNQARYLRDCLDGCLAQRIEGAEILVFDGGSSDGTRAVLESYGERVTWRMAPDRGQSDAINQGVRAAKGEIVAWINSDDFYADPGVLRRVLDRFAADSALDVVHGDGWMVDAAGRRFRRYRSRELERGRALLGAPSAVVQPALFFRRQLFLDVGGLDEQLHWAMDLDLWMRMLPAARRVAYVSEPLACLRCHEEAKTYRGMLKQIREIRQIKGRYLSALHPDVVLRLSSHLADTKLYVYWAAVRLGLWKAV
jgi:glycosyltransferase involved in cell wall biosynthesis